MRPTPTCTHFHATELPCLKCGNVMTLALIEPANPKFELRTYECEPCGERESFLMAIIQPLENTALSSSG
jgi:hypothetical protein